MKLEILATRTQGFVIGEIELATLKCVVGATVGVLLLQSLADLELVVGGDGDDLIPSSLPTPVDSPNHSHAWPTLMVMNPT